MQINMITFPPSLFSRAKVMLCNRVRKDREFESFTASLPFYYY